MLSFGKSKRVVNIAVDDNVIRMVENNGKDLSSIKIIGEKQIPLDVIERGRIVDELAFYDFVKELIQQWGIKNRNVRFYAPHDLIIMREIDIPEHTPKDELKQYITMEIGHTIHFPFKNPVFDLYHVTENEQNQKVTVIAAPEEEIMKYTEIFADANLKPVAVDVHALGVYRYFLSKDQQITKDDVYLLLELNLTAVNISIFHNHTLEFLRYQPLNISNNWEAEGEEKLHWTFTGDEANLQGEISDQVNDLERLMSFYRYSLHQGEKAVTKIVLLGNYPQLNEVQEQLTNQYEIPILTLSTRQLENEQINAAFIPVLGLAIKGEM